MSRIFVPLILIISAISITAQTRTDAAVAEVHVYQVVPGKSYLVSVAPEGRSDVVLGVGSDPSKPISVVNNLGTGLSETYRLQAATNELQVSVYNNSKNGKHTIAVIGEDQRFPFYRGSTKTSVLLSTDAEGYIESFGFRWYKRDPVETRASSDVNKGQIIAAGEAILYTFPSHPQFPLDIMVVPDTNHLDLALQIGDSGEYELNDNNRSRADLYETGKGQVEWVQFNPKGDTLDVIVINKSDFAGSFRLAVRVMFNDRPALRPSKWEILNPKSLAKRLDKSRSKLPYIDSQSAATFEFTPVRTVQEYTFGAISLDPGLNFALVVRIDPKKPPLFIQAGGSYTRLAVFTWRSVNGTVSVYRDDKRLFDFGGYPSPGKIQISIMGYGGSGRVGVILKDETLAPLEIPKHRAVSREAVNTLLTGAYDNNRFIQSNFRLYRFESRFGRTYKVQAVPHLFFDAVLMDPSGRNFENPNALALVDEKGRGEPETLEITATADFIEFAVAGARYVNGIVYIDNKRLGGAGFYQLRVVDEEGKTPELREEVEVTLPNEFVSKELDLIYQPWDPFEVETASDLPPFTYEVDKRITQALAHPLEPLNRAANSRDKKNPK
ncbi:MAG: hypothetical protein OEM82_07105 [Acidobacteriota bacterium]|nr:hypothetical protein [Acidobacteriota bacterium]MDH3528730.1 hypothetical protein [Acidobacteriota bacterium]